MPLDLIPLLDLTPLDEESTPFEERPPRGTTPADFVEPPPRPQYSLDDPIVGGKPFATVAGRTVESLPASLDVPEAPVPSRVVAPFDIAEFSRTGTPENPYGVATPEERAFTAAQPSEFDRPVIPPGVFKTALDIGSATLPRSEMLEGFKEGTAEQLSGMTSQSSAAMLPAFAIPYVGPALAMGMGAKAVGAGAGTVVGGAESGDLREVGQGLSEVAGGGLMVAAPLMHGGITRPTIPPHIIETIAKADAIGLKRSAQAYADTVKQSQRSAATTAVETKPTEVTSAESIRSDQGQVRGEGPRPEVVPEISGENLQQPAPIPREPTRAQGGEAAEVLLRPVEQFVADLESGKPIATEAAHEFGRTISTPEEIAQLKQAYTDMSAKARKALREIPDTATDAEMAATMALSQKPGLINEAIDGATGADKFKLTDVKKFNELREAGKPINEKAKTQTQTQPGVAGAGGETARDISGLPEGRLQGVQSGAKATVAQPTVTEVSKPAPIDTSAPTGSILPEPAAKEPWQITRSEYRQQKIDSILSGEAPQQLKQRLEKQNSIGGGRVAADVKSAVDARKKEITDAKKGIVDDSFHRSQVVARQRIGKPVPPEVLAAYPDLQKPATSQAVEPALASAESKLAEVVNQTIEQSSPTRLGVSPAATMRPMDVVLGAPDLRSISPAVEARWQQAVKGTEGIIDKVKANATEAWKSVTREYADLPPREFPAEIDVLRRQRASPNASARTTVDVLKGITHNLGPKQYGVFNRVALLEDLVKDVESGKYSAGNDLPFGYKDAGELTADLNKFRSVAEATPQIKAALERRQEFMDSLRSTLVERGFLPESVLSDPRYFHHQVLLYMAEKNAPTGSRSFRDWFSGWQKKRTGSSLDYNRQYVEAEAEVIADAFNKFTNQDLHGEMQGIADIAPQLKEVHGAEWRQHIPKSYTTWQPKRGNIFYQVQTVAERVMDRYLSGLGDILPSEFKEALAVGGRRQEWVIPKPLAKVLDNIAPRPDNWIGRLATTAQNSWKRYILLNPLRAAKYNLNNLSGDLDFLFAAQPKIFKEFKSSASDMWGFHVKGKSAVGDIKDAIQDGVISSGWRASELPDIARSDYFNWLTGEKPKLVDRYWNWIGKRTDAREDTGRLASYRYAKKEWEAGRPFYGASVPADVNALATPRLKAAKVAREILIDYGRGTEFSNFTRQKLVPFFKWMEGNFVRYQQLIRNIPEHEGAGPRVAGAAGKKATTLALRMGAAYGIINLWNHMFFPKEEEELGEARNQLHLILGRDEQGNIQTIRFQGALSDLLGWVGGEDLPQDVKDLATGKASVGDKMEDAYEAGISRAVNASLPFPKTAAEVGLGRSFYPNALQPRPVRDKAEHAAGLFSLKPVYQWLAGKPHKPLRQEIANLISYTTDPGEAAYNTTRHMAGEWLEEHGEERASVIPGKRSNALYYYKQALRYKDQETAQKFLDEYNKLGGKREGLSQSLKASAPMSMLGNNRKAFLDSLSPQEQEAVRRAEEWYRRVYARPPTPNPNP